MAVRRVVAAIDVVINGQRNVDRLATAYNKVENAANSTIRTLGRVTTSTTATAAAFNTLGTGLRTATGSFMGFVNAIDRGRDRIDRHTRSTRGMTDNILSLTKSMLLFSVMLPIVQFPQRVIESFGDFVKVGAAWQDQMRVSNGLLNLTEEQFKSFNVQVQQMSIRNGVATESMRELLQTAASSVSAITPNVQKMEQLGKAAYDASVALELANQASRLARSTGTDAKNATTSLIQSMATYGLTIEHAAEVSDKLFAITDVGTVTLTELESTLPRVTAAMGPMIQRYTEAGDKMNVMNESFAAFAAMTQVMPAEQAATSFANIYKNISQMTGKQKDLVEGWEKVRKAQGLDDRLSLAPEKLLDQGPIAILTQMRNVFDLRGKMVDAYVANQRRQGSTAPEEALRVTGQSQLLQAYFEDMRAVRGFQLITAEGLARVQNEFNASAPGAVERGLTQRSKSFLDAQQRFGAGATALKTSLFESIEQPLIGGIDPITNMMSNLIQNADFQNSDFLSKIRMMGTTFLTSFGNWFRAGGREQLTTVGRDIGTFIGQAVTGFFAGGKDNVLVEAATAFSAAFVSGIGQTLPEMLGNMLRSSMVKAVAEMIAIRYMTKSALPAAASRTLAVAGASALELGPAAMEGYAGGIPSALMGVVGTGLIAAGGMAALQRGSRALFNAGTTDARGPGRRIGSISGIRSPGGLMQAISILAANRRANTMTIPGMVPTSGPAWPGIGGVLRGGRAVGGNALLSAALTIPAILSANSEREKWSTIGGAIGGIGGAALGGAAGAPIGGIGGFIAGAAGGVFGGGLGQAAGGGLYDLLHPSTGKGGLAEADAPERVAAAEVFATGIDNSLAIPLLQGILNTLIRGGGSTLLGAARTSASTPQVTGRGLQSSFVNQMDTTQLTAAQAQAACGPAAATFFAKAYGRNPTLKEAYSIVSQIQGGDPKDVGGTRGVATLGAALTRMGVTSEVYEGSNIDWGRLAENAKVGVPGIVNIGPQGRFPGHFFQIGGYDPSNNRFNVGSSGTNLQGGKEWMTPEEMMALGPKMGAVYGLGRTGTGGGNITEADIANIPNTAGTGTGPGGAGGTVTVNIQNMMNVEHMDGTTDIRSLMGQMAEILRQLSTGGSVVGQNGVVTP